MGEALKKAEVLCGKSDYSGDVKTYYLITTLKFFKSVKFQRIQIFGTVNSCSHTKE